MIVIYINDISTNITYIIKIYADDICSTKIYRKINVPEPEVDILALQSDLDRLGEWANQCSNIADFINQNRKDLIHVSQSYNLDYLLFLAS